MKEIAVISGKGGAGKTSLTASLALLAQNSVVVADCDVDAADLHLILSPKLLERHQFISGKEAKIRPEDCIKCGQCRQRCRFGAVAKTTSGACHIDSLACEGCGVCVRICPAQAIDFTDRLCGEWMVAETRTGPMVHARLKAAAENSGKLVSTVRREARRIAQQEDYPWILVDGPPGIGCPVIASVAGATMVLAVTEPTVSGEHDLKRVLSLTQHFRVPAMVCVNKWDLHPPTTERIEQEAHRANARIVGRIRYDSAVTTAQIQERAVVELDTPAAEDIRGIWKQISQ